jgi:tRNA 2-thiouridine synthesizing protein A
VTPDPGFGPVTELDCRGRACPMPVIALAQALPGLAVDEVVAVVADDPAAAVDVPAWCRMKGQEYVGMDTADDGTPRYLVRRVA